MTALNFELRQGAEGCLLCHSKEPLLLRQGLRKGPQVRRDLELGPGTVGVGMQGALQMLERLEEDVQNPEEGGTGAASRAQTQAEPLRRPWTFRPYRVQEDTKTAGS